MSKPPSNGIPILGRTVATVPAQLRLNITEEVGKALAMVKDLGVRIGRVILMNPVDSTDLGYLLYLEALEQAGCSIVAINEHAVQTPQGGGALQCHVTFRAPEAFFRSSILDA